MKTVRNEVIRLYTEKFCGAYTIAKRLGLSVDEVKRILKEEGVPLRHRGKKYGMPLIKEVGRRLEEKEGQTLKAVINDMKAEGYCLDVSGFKKALPSLSLEEFLTILPVRRKGVSFAVGEGNAGTFVVDGCAENREGRWEVYRLSMVGDYVVVDRIVPYEGSVGRFHINQLEKIINGLPESSLFLADSGVPRHILKKKKAVFVASSLFPSFRMVLHFPYVPGTTRATFVEELCRLSLGGRSRVFRVKSHAMCFYIRVMDKNLPSSVVKFFLPPGIGHEDAERTAEVLSHLFGSGELSASLLPCRLRGVTGG